MSAASLAPHKRPRKLWWLIGALIFVLCVLVQTPAAWIVQKYAPDSPYLQHVSGNLWQGSVIWQLPQAPAGRSGLSGSLEWHWQPWKIVLGRMGAEVTLVSGQTRLTGQVDMRRHGWAISDMSGKIAQETLAQLVDWRLPEAPIQVNALSLQKDKQRGFIAADGQLTWVGGEMGYPSGNKTYQLNLPAMRAELSAEQKGEQQLLHVNLLDNKDKRLGDLYLDKDLMLDINLTQRLLETMPDYQGKAPQDTPVVSVRQPLLASLGANK